MIGLATNTDYVERLTNLVPTSSDYTICGYFHPVVNTSGGNYRTIFEFDNGAGAYVGIFSGIGTQSYNLELNNGAGSGDLGTSGFNISSGSAIPVFFAYVRSGNAHRFYLGINNGLLGTITADLSVATFTAFRLGNDTTSQGNVKLSYVREFTRALNLYELSKEAQSNSAFDTTDNWTDYSFLTDINDASGHGYNLSQAGSATFDTPPTAVDIGSTFPYSRVVTQAEFNISNLFWFSIANVTSKVLGSFTNEGGITFSPNTAYYLNDGVTILLNSGSGTVSTRQVIRKGTYYIKITRSGGGASDFDFTTQFDTALLNNLTIPSNAIIINDDEYVFPATVMTLSGTVVGFLDMIPGGEIGAAAPNGTMLWHDRYGFYDASLNLALFDPNFNLVTLSGDTFDAGASSISPYFCCNGTNFYILISISGTYHLFKITQLGVITDLNITFGTQHPRAFIVNSDETKFYWVTGNFDTAIHVFDITNNVQLADLYTISGDVGVVGVGALNGNNGEILFNQAGNLVTFYSNNAQDEWTLIEVDTSGNLITTKTFTGAYALINHINYSIVSGQIHIWFFDDTTSGDTGKFASLKLSDGSLPESFTTDLFSSGIGLVSDSDIMFGPSTSCTMLTYLFEIFGGIYKLVPNSSQYTPRRNDKIWTNFSPPTSEEVKIPDPFIETAAFGD